jgi:hypothetical protein
MLKLYTVTNASRKALMGQVTVALASREWAIGGNPICQGTVKKTRKLREEITLGESRPQPVAPVIGL